MRLPQWIPRRPDAPGIALAALLGALAMTLIRVLPPSPFISDVLVALIVGALIINTPLRRPLGLAWPAGLDPVPTELAVEPDDSDPLPRADALVVTWTIAEMLALADVLTPGVNPRTRWYRYKRHFDDEYVPLIRGGAPARMAGRLGSYYPSPALSLAWSISPLPLSFCWA